MGASIPPASARERRAKIICTLGPAVDSDQRVGELIDAGMNAARINLSYDDAETHLRALRRVRSVARDKKQQVAVIFDLPGSKLRLGRIQNDRQQLTVGQSLLLVPDSGTGAAAGSLPVDARFFGTELIRGDSILMCDGAVSLRVTAIKKDEITTEVVRGGQIHTRTDVFVPGAEMPPGTWTEADQAHLRLAVEQEVDYIAVTYVTDASDVLAVRERLEKLGRSVPIIVKIERAEAVGRLDGILSRADAIMIRRGDLGAQIELTHIPLVQKELIRVANNRGVPVIIGKEMLGSMVRSHRPTRAECSDVSNGVADGVDAVMLSSETAIGAFPIEALQMMDRIVRETERETFIRERVHELVDYPSPFPDTTARIACRAAVECDAKLIVCFTESGRSAGLVAKYRPEVPIVAFCHSEATQRRLALHWGVQVDHLEIVRDAEEMVRRVDARLLETGRARKGDRVVIVFGAPVGERGHTNSVRLNHVGLPG